ncbi:MAG: GIY-YIG nuclease family protein [Acidobacteriaceae bacterium]|nr:GIY-YIG nuclease family protein [Acidobacteriaceae bacterium]MBV9767308.1 GIY-YIG nuclease family protein [Acidobacteriaceae bacterium]
MDRQQILEDIKRLALENGGQAPGRQAFENATGVKMSQWYPHTWLRWGDALAEAGYAPNSFQAKTGDDELLERYIAFTRELGRFPVEGEIRRKGREDQSFPSHSVFRRFGGKQKLLNAVAAYGQKRTGYEDVLALCDLRKNGPHPHSPIRKSEPRIATEFVYLMKSGTHYKIGRTNSVGRRGSELAIKIPVPPTTIHSIETDDPIGVEAYWHRRFADKRGQGEWFVLTQEDVKAFKRWKKIV